MNGGSETRPTRPGLVWERRDRSSAGPRPSLGRERIVRFAVNLADEEGVDAVTMRHVASRLGSGTMSLYRHIFNRDELLDLMVDSVYGEIQPAGVPDGGPSWRWRAELHRIAHDTRAVFKRHPWVAPVVSTRRLRGPNSLKRLESSLAAVEDLGLEAGEMAGLPAVVDDFVVGFVLRELAEEATRRRTRLGEQEWRAAERPYVELVVESGPYPNLARLIRGGQDAGAGEAFGFGLERILDGVAAYVAAHGRR